MSGLSSVLLSLGRAAADLATRMVPGAAPLIAAAHSIASAFETVKASNGGTAPAEAQAGHDALLARVRAHADSTLGRLEGASQR